MQFNHEIFFDHVRDDPFDGHLTQSQVNGMEAILDGWEEKRPDDDVRWLAYFLATCFHETAQAMQPVEEYGKGEGQPYGEPDPETGECYYGRGFVQLTWKDNYARADSEIGCDSVSQPEQQLEAKISGATGYKGMIEGWFRSPNTFAKFFNDDTEDAYGAREIINGDKHVVPDWSNGVSIGNLIVGYYEAFLEALTEASVEEPQPEPSQPFMSVAITASEGVKLSVTVNGEEL